MVRKEVNIKDIENKGFVQADIVVLDPRQQEIMNKIEFDMEHKYKLDKKEKMGIAKKALIAIGGILGASAAIKATWDGVGFVGKNAPKVIPYLKGLGLTGTHATIFGIACVAALGIMVSTKFGGTDYVAKKLGKTRETVEIATFTTLVGAVSSYLLGTVGAIQGGAVAGPWGAVAGAVAGVGAGTFFGYLAYRMLANSRDEYWKAGKDWSVNDVVADFGEDLGIPMEWARPEHIRIGFEATGSEDWMKKKFGKKEDILIEGFVNELQIESMEDFNKIQEMVNIEGYFEGDSYADVQFKDIQDVDHFYKETKPIKESPNFEAYDNFSSQFGNVSKEPIKEVNLNLENNIFY